MCVSVLQILLQSIEQVHLCNRLWVSFSGTMTASEAFANFFKSVGQSFMQLAAQMIAKLIVINLALKTALDWFVWWWSDAKGVRLV